jgi:hypothetical protein
MLKVTDDQRFESFKKEIISKLDTKKVFNGERGGYTKRVGEPVCIMGALRIAVGVADENDYWRTQIKAATGLSEHELFALEVGYEGWNYENEIFSEFEQALRVLGGRVRMYLRDLNYKPIYSHY